MTHFSYLFFTKSISCLGAAPYGTRTVIPYALVVADSGYLNKLTYFPHPEHYPNLRKQERGKFKTFTGKATRWNEIEDKAGCQVELVPSLKEIKARYGGAKDIPEQAIYQPAAFVEIAGDGEQLADEPKQQACSGRIESEPEG